MLNLKSYLTTSLVAALSILSQYGYADTVFLINGDRITGEIIELDDKQLTLKPSYTGKITLARSAISSLETDERRHWSVNRSLEHVTISAASEPRFVMINGQLTPLNEIRYSAIEASTDWLLSGSAEAAIDITQNTTHSQKLHAKGDMTLQSLNWRHDLKGEFRYETEESTPKRHSFEGRYTLDYLLSEHWLLRQEDFYEEDRLSTQQKNYYIAVGPGHRFWGVGRNKLDFVLTYNHFWVNTPYFEFDLYAWATALNYKQYWLGGELETYADLQMAFPEIPSIDYIANSTLGLRYLLTQRVYLTLKYDLNETKTDITNIKDSNYTLGLGMNF
ncbi:MAG: DUF481 domain-containing protein [Shewanella sp.]